MIIIGLKTYLPSRPLFVCEIFTSKLTGERQEKKGSSRRTQTRLGERRDASSGNHSNAYKYTVMATSKALHSESVIGSVSIIPWKIRVQIIVLSGKLEETDMLVIVNFSIYSHHQW